MTRRLAIIPARSGSKGIPRKNMAKINGETLIARSIKVALSTNLFERIIVSTDAEDFAEEAIKYGAEVPFMRPNHLSTDDAKITDVIKHLIKTLAENGETYDMIALLEPTSPLRTKEIVMKTIKAAEAPQWDAALTISPIPRQLHPLKQLNISPAGEALYYQSEGAKIINRQELSRTYQRNGMCYAFKTEAFMATHSVFGNKAKAISVENDFVSIDRPEDLEEAKNLISKIANKYSLE